MTFGHSKITVSFVIPTEGKMLKIFQTLDGSNTLTDENLNETYHSINGAVQESMHVFIQQGLLALNTKKVNCTIFEMGFGTGLNALLTSIHQPKEMSVAYHALEGFPIDSKILEELNYFTLSEDEKLYQKIIECPFDVWKNIQNGFLLKKEKNNFLTAELPLNLYDIIYYDAFGPKIQPELWTVDCMKKCFDSLAHGGILVSYCAQGQFKRNLKAVGFKVEELPGPPGKREMTRAKKV